MKPTKAEVDAVARQLLATVPEPPRCRPGDQALRRADFLFVKPETDFGLQPDDKPFKVFMRFGPEVLEPRQPLLEWGPLFEAAIRQRVAADQRRAMDRQRANQQRMRTYPAGCTCPKLPADGTPQTYDLTCPIQGHRRLALAARHRKC